MTFQRLPLGGDTDTKFLVMPFGLTNASVAFIDFIHRVFSPYLVQYVIIFVDDIFSILFI